LIYGEGNPPQIWPNVDISKDGRWLVISASDGTNNNRLFLKDLKSYGALVELSQDKDHLYSADVLDGNVYLHTNDGAPRFHLFKFSAEHPERANWKEIVPQTDAVLNGTQLANGQIILDYEK